MTPYLELPALSIRQPWAWLIVNGHKDIENRTWPTQRRGRFFVHAASGMTRREYAFAVAFAQNASDVVIPEFEALERGGIVGTVHLTDCVQSRPSRWFVGPYGFVLADPKPIPFYPCRGWLGFFKQRVPGVSP